MKWLVVKRAEIILDNVISRHGMLGFLAGLLFTIVVQSSSVTTSLLVPLVAAESTGPDLVGRMLQRDPEERPPDLVALFELLQEYSRAAARANARAGIHARRPGGAS